MKKIVEQINSVVIIKFWKFVERNKTVNLLKKSNS